MSPPHAHGVSVRSPHLYSLVSPLAVSRFLGASQAPRSSRVCTVWPHCRRSQLPRLLEIFEHRTVLLLPAIHVPLWPPPWPRRQRPFEMVTARSVCVFLATGPSSAARGLAPCGGYLSSHAIRGWCHSIPPAGGTAAARARDATRAQRRSRPRGRNSFQRFLLRFLFRLSFPRCFL